MLAQGFDELIDLAASGDHRNVDMLVKDIYGGSHNVLGLPGDIIASSFGRAARSASDRECKRFFFCALFYVIMSVMTKGRGLSCVHCVQCLTSRHTLYITTVVNDCSAGVQRF